MSLKQAEKKRTQLDAFDASQIHEGSLDWASPFSGRPSPGFFLDGVHKEKSFFERSKPLVRRYGIRPNLDSEFRNETEPFTLRTLSIRKLWSFLKY